MKLYPMPYIYNEKKDFWCFSGEVVIKYNENFPTDKTLNVLSELWRHFTAEKSELIFIKDNTITPHTLSTSNETPQHNDEYEYSIVVTNDGFSASANTYIGLVHAVFSLLQLIQPERINNDEYDKFHISSCEIYDKPSLKFRCFHLAVTDEMTYERLQLIIRLCAFYKYSHLLIEFFGSFKFECNAALSLDNAFTKEQLKPLINEGIALGLEFVPMYNHFGHAACYSNKMSGHVILEQAPELLSLFEPDGWCFCLSNPNTKKLLKSIRNELIELFGEGSYLHIGGDEAYSIGTCDICKEVPIEKLYSDYINEIANEMKSRNRRVIIWGDSMLSFYDWEQKTDSFGHKYIASEGVHENSYKSLYLLDKSVIINDWQYFIWDSCVETSNHFKSLGFDVIPASYDEVKNTDALCEAARKYNYLGQMQTVWNNVFQPILITRGATSAWIHDISQIDKEAYGRHNFVREYALMAYRSRAIMQMILPNVEWK